MVGSTSGVSLVGQVSAISSSSNAARRAALEEQIKAKKEEAKTAKDQSVAAKVAGELAALKAKLAALEATDKKQTDPVARKQAVAEARTVHIADKAQQAGFDAVEPSASGVAYSI